MLRREWQLTLISAIGSGLEYYCFVCYILLSSYLSALLFPGNQHSTQMLGSLLVFALGYFVTPLSALSFGHFADKYGRQKVFALSLLLMSGATFCMGLIPPYAKIGALATALLVLLRIAQGISQGAELPGAITFLCEHLQSAHRGRYCGMLFLGVGMGAMLGSFINFLLTHFLSHAAMLAFGWRIPFLLAGMLGLVGYWIRRHTSETPLFLAQHKATRHNIPLTVLLKTRLSSVFIGMGIVWLGACLVSFGLFLPTFLITHLGFASAPTYLAFSLTFVLDVLLIALGDLSDRVGRRRLFITGLVINLVCFYPLFHWLIFKTVLVLYLFNMLYHLLILLLASCYPAMLAELFPTSLRYSGIAASYLGAYSLAGATPLLVMIAYTHFPHLVTLVAWFMFSATISLVAAIFYKIA